MHQDPISFPWDLLSVSFAAAGNLTILLKTSFYSPPSNTFSIAVKSVAPITIVFNQWLRLQVFYAFTQTARAWQLEYYLYTECWLCRLCCLAYYIDKQLFMQEIVHGLFSFLLLYGQENKMNTHSQSHDKIIEGQARYVSCIQDEVFLTLLLVSCPQQ